jgi:hypothetical protein
MDRVREPAEEAPAPAIPVAAPQAPAVAQVLALQRSAGNAAVGRMLSRFYIDNGTGSPTWEAGEPGSEYEATGKNHRWFFWDYPLYAKKADEPTGPGKNADKNRKKRERAKANKANKAVEDDVLEDETPEQEDEQPVEQAPVAEKPKPKPKPIVQQEPEDDGGYVQKKSKAAMKKEQRSAFTPEEVTELVRQVDRHAGEPKDISEAFNQLFNILEAQGQLANGALADAYVSNDDVGVGFSVEISIPRLGNWVAHAHLDATGKVIADENATHYKRAAQKYDRGVSVSLSRRQVMALMPNAAACLAYARVRTANKTGNRRVM